MEIYDSGASHCMLPFKDHMISLDYPDRGEEELPDEEQPPPTHRPPLSYTSCPERPDSYQERGPLPHRGAGPMASNPKYLSEAQSRADWPDWSGSSDGSRARDLEKTKLPRVRVCGPGNGEGVRRRSPSFSKIDSDMCSAEVILRTRSQYSPFNQSSRLYLTSRRDF
jgi:hypothetical protein